MRKLWDRAAWWIKENPLAFYLAAVLCSLLAIVILAVLATYFWLAPASR